MDIPFVILCLTTLILWFLVVFLHQERYKITIIPLYAYIAVLTILMHNLTDLQFAITVDQWFFLIPSFSLFTTLMFGTLFLYLFEGPRAARVALGVILFSSFFYIGMVYFLGFEVDTTKWVQFSLDKGMYYFWSMLAIILDVLFMAIFWELLSKIKSLNLMVRVFLVIFGVFALDSLVFTTGAFGNTEFYSAILKGNLAIRFILSLIGAPIMAHFMKEEGFTEEGREKPKNFWEIMNFRSDLEIKILSLEETIAEKKMLEEKLKGATETYELAIAGAGAGIWDLDIPSSRIHFSDKLLQLLGYENGELEDDFNVLKASILNPEDSDRVVSLFEKRLSDGKPFEAECRFKNKSGQYRWFLVNGITKYDDGGKPVRMVGSAIDIDLKKEAEAKLKEKIAELTKFNEVMLGRELKMIDLKKEIDELKKSR